MLHCKHPKCGAAYVCFLKILAWLSCSKLSCPATSSGRISQCALCICRDSPGPGIRIALYKHRCVFLFKASMHIYTHLISSHLFLFVYNILIFHPLQPDHVGQMGSLHVKCQHVPTRWWFGWSDSAGLFIGAARFTLRIPIHRWCIYHFCGQPYLGGCKYWVIRHPWVFDPQQVRFFLRNAGLKEEERLGIAWAAGLESQDVSKHL
jgi:hypothetical protein